jgi:hypothetical protein
MYKIIVLYIFNVQILSNRWDDIYSRLNGSMHLPNLILPSLHLEYIPGLLLLCPST